jgi:hypothetical protein
MSIPVKRKVQDVYNIQENFRLFCERELGYMPCQRIKIGNQWTDYVLPLSDEEYADLGNTKGQKLVIYVDVQRAKEVWDAIGIRYYDRDRFVGISFATDFNLLRDYSQLGKKHTLWVSPTPKIIGPNGYQLRFGDKFRQDVELLERAKDFDEVIYALKYDVPLALQ